MKIKLLIIFTLLLIFSLTLNAKPQCGIKYFELFKKDTVKVEVECRKSGGWAIYRTLRDTLHGKTETYYPDGKLTQECYYEHGKESGVKKGYLPDGFLSVSKPYRNGIPIDTHKVWFKNKKQESIIVYDTLGNKNGWSRHWYESSSTLKDSTLFSHGDKLEEHTFYSSGKPMFNFFMKPDGSITKATTFLPNGTKGGEVKNGNGRIIIPKHWDNETSFDTLTIKNGKIQDPDFKFFND